MSPIIGLHTDGIAGKAKELLDAWLGTKGAADIGAADADQAVEQDPDTGRLYWTGGAG